jgi:hypothetical protein
MFTQMTQLVRHKTLASSPRTPSHEAVSATLGCGIEMLNTESVRWCLLRRLILGLSMYQRFQRKKRLQLDLNALNYAPPYNTQAWPPISRH